MGQVAESLYDSRIRYSNHVGQTVCDRKSVHRSVLPDSLEDSNALESCYNDDEVHLIVCVFSVMIVNVIMIVKCLFDHFV